jgi:hypothetical protein
MPSHYTDQDRERLSPKAAIVRAWMFGNGFYTLEQVAKATGLKEGTVASRLRELCDREHSYLGLAYERRRVGNGVNEYRLFERQPAQLPLLEGVAA